MKKLLLITLAVLTLVGTVALAACASGDCQEKRPDRTRAPKFYEKLDLTPQQQQKLLALRQDFQKETQPLRFEMQKKQLELRQLWSAKPLNQSAIETKSKEMAALRVQMVNKTRALREKMKNILTTDQRKILEEAKPKGNPGHFGRPRRGGRK